MKMASLWHIIVAFLGVFSPSWATPAVNTSAIIRTLTIDFYKAKCPNVEKIVADIMNKSVQLNPGYIPGILRLHFHDCFVTGCDGSILISSEKYNSYNPEMTHPANSISLRGVDVIYQIKNEVEKQCPGVVSCADILAYAARESVVLAGNPHYVIPAGRRDGININGNFASDLPNPGFNIDLLTEMYAVRGLTVEDLVTLEGSHSIGRTRCSGTMIDGAPNNVTESKAIFDQQFGQAVIKQYCPSSSFATLFSTFTPLNPLKNDTAWGVSFYDNIMQGKGLLPSDLAMAVNVNTKDLVKQYATDAELWKKKFNEAMIKMGKINVLTGTQGEIRKSCGLINSINMPVPL